MKKLSKKKGYEQKTDIKKRHLFSLWLRKWTVIKKKAYEAYFAFTLCLWSILNKSINLHRYLECLLWFAAVQLSTSKPFCGIPNRVRRICAFWCHKWLHKTCAHLHTHACNNCQVVTEIYDTTSFRLISFHSIWTQPTCVCLAITNAPALDPTSANAYSSFFSWLVAAAAEYFRLQTDIFLFLLLLVAYHSIHNILLGFLASLVCHCFHSGSGSFENSSTIFII